MFRRVNVGGNELQVRDEGTGRPVLLVHGFPLDHTMWRAQIETLRGACRVLAVDLRGFGGSGGDQADVVTMAEYADDCASLLDELEIREPVVFCGLSMGGYIAWQFWARHASRLGALILCDTRAAADSPETARGRLQMAERTLREGTTFLVETMAEKLFDRRTRQEQPAQIDAVRDVMTRTSPRAIAAALRGMARRDDMTPRLGEIQVPTLVVCGEADVITPASEMRAMATAIRGAKYVEIPRAGHMSPLEQPAAVNPVILDFLPSIVD